MSEDYSCSETSLHKNKDFIKCLVNIHAIDNETFQNEGVNNYLYMVQNLVEKTDMLINTTAFQMACKHGYISAAMYLFKTKGVDIHANNELALRLASENGHLPIVQFLIEKGANICTKAFECACKNGHMSVVECLVNQDVYLVLDSNKGLQLSLGNKDKDIFNFILKKRKELKTSLGIKTGSTIM